jgi:hypothetical protein
MTLTCPTVHGLHQQRVGDDDAVVGPGLDEEAARFRKVEQVHNVGSLAELTLQNGKRTLNLSMHVPVLPKFL